MNKQDTVTLDELMTAALREIVREDWEAAVSSPAAAEAAADAPPVSRDCAVRMERLLGAVRPRRRGGIPKRIALGSARGILIALSVIAMLGMAMRPVREAFVNTVVTWYDRHLGVRYETADAIPAVIEDVVLPSRLPDGWSLETNFHTAYLYSHTILNAGDGRIFLDQHIIKPNEEMDRFDGTDVAVETVLLNGRTAAKLFSYADGRQALMWTDRYVFILRTDGKSADAGMLVGIAESMEDRMKS